MSDIKAARFGDAIAATLSDTVPDPAGPFDGFYTGAGGDIKVQTYGVRDSGGRAIIFASTPAGVVIWCRITRVWSTGTVATSVLGLTAQ